MSSKLVLSALCAGLLLATAGACRSPAPTGAGLEPGQSRAGGLQLETGRLYRATLVRKDDTGDWWPEEGIQIPYHHWARIEWTNLHEFEAFSQSSRVRATFAVVDSVVERVGEREQWRTRFYCEVTKAKAER